MGERLRHVQIFKFGEMGMGGVDARIDDRPDDAFAQRLKRALGGIGLHGDEGTRQGGEDVVVAPDLEDRSGFAAGFADTRAGFGGKAENLCRGEAGEAILRGGGDRGVECGDLGANAFGGRVEATLKRFVEPDDDVEPLIRHVGRGYQGCQRLHDDGAHHIEADVVARRGQKVVLLPYE